MATKRIDRFQTNGDRLPELFESGGKAGEDTERLVADLHQKIGELTVDLDFMKRKSKQLGL